MTLVGSTGSPANAARVAAIPLPSRGATGEQPVTVGDGYAFGRIDSLDFIPAAKRAAVFTARTGSDVTTELQAMIDYCKTNRRNGLIRAGYYIISSPLVFTSVALEGISIRGEGHGYAVSGGTGGVTSETILDASSILTKPALVIQFARGLHLSDIGILGPNTAPIGLSEPSNTAADYLSAGVRDSRYSPQCAIAIDPTTGSDPGGGAGYPGMTYTGAGGGGSASILLERITMRNHNVGLLVTPTVAGAQGDFIIARDINVFGAHIDRKSVV